MARATSSARGIGEDDHRLLAGAEGEGSTGGMYGPGKAAIASGGWRKGQCMAPTKRPQDGGEVVQGVAVVNTVKVLGGEVIPVVADNSSVVVGTVFSSPYQSLWYGASPSTFCDIGAERFRCDVEGALDYCLHRAGEPGSSLKSDKEWG